MLIKVKINFQRSSKEVRNMKCFLTPRLSLSTTVRAASYNTLCSLQAFNPSTQEAEGNICLSLRPAGLWSSRPVIDGLHGYRRAREKEGGTKTENVKEKGRERRKRGKVSQSSRFSQSLHICLKNCTILGLGDGSIGQTTCKQEYLSLHLQT